MVAKESPPLPPRGGVLRGVLRKGGGGGLTCVFVHPFSACFLMAYYVQGPDQVFKLQTEIKGLQVEWERPGNQAEDGVMAGVSSQEDPRDLNIQTERHCP